MHIATAYQTRIEHNLMTLNPLYESLDTVPHQRLKEYLECQRLPSIPVVNKLGPHTLPSLQRRLLLDTSAVMRTVALGAVDVDLDQSLAGVVQLGV